MVFVDDSLAIDSSLQLFQIDCCIGDAVQVSTIYNALASFLPEFLKTVESN